ncbi:MAG: glycosyltransferase family 4 protein [Gammaproteobacteria bacterium]|nr:glycosyltransferase family 4 protein [Gammaproteobacteria bacterium]
MDKPKVRIAVLIRHYNPFGGGAERYAVELTKRLCELYEVHVFAQTIEERSADIIFHTIPQWLEHPRYINQLLFSWFTRKATQGKFTVVHSHDMVTHANLYTLHVPCVKTRWTETHGWRKGLRWLNTILSPRKIAYLWLENRQISPRNGKQLIAVSEFLVRNIAHNYPQSTDAITIAYPGIHPKPVTKKNPAWRSQHNIPEDAFTLLFVANNFKRKGLPALLHALEQLNNPQIHLIVAGNGQAEQLQISKSMEQNILFLGVVKEMKKLYPNIDAMVHPTLVDTYGMAVLEAMAQKIPVIVSNQHYCGFSEHLSDQEAILLKNPQNSAEIAEKIDFLFNHPEDRNRMALQGFKNSQSITWDQTLEQTLAAYHRLIQPTEQPPIPL